MFKLLDSEELDYLSLTEPFGLIDDLSEGTVNGALMKKLIAAEFKLGTKITNDSKEPLKNLYINICGTDSITDMGVLDYFLGTGKTIDEFISEFAKFYAMIAVCDSRVEAIRLIGRNTEISALRDAAENV